MQILDLMEFSIASLPTLKQQLGNMRWIHTENRKRSYPDLYDAQAGDLIGIPSASLQRALRAVKSKRQMATLNPALYEEFVGAQIKRVSLTASAIRKDHGPESVSGCPLRRLSPSLVSYPAS
jgi:hypothetical protein